MLDKKQFEVEQRDVRICPRSNLPVPTWSSYFAFIGERWFFQIRPGKTTMYRHPLMPKICAKQYGVMRAVARTEFCDAADEVWKASEFYRIDDNGDVQDHVCSDAYMDRNDITNPEDVLPLFDAIQRTLTEVRRLRTFADCWGKRL